jgi:hypothetical protein
MKLPARIVLLLALGSLSASLPYQVLYFFPRAWLLIALFVWFGWADLRGLSRREWTWGTGLAFVTAFIVTLAAPASIDKQGRASTFAGSVELGEGRIFRSLLSGFLRLHGQGGGGRLPSGPRTD